VAGATPPPRTVTGSAEPAKAAASALGGGGGRPARSPCTTSAFPRSSYGPDADLRTLAPRPRELWHCPLISAGVSLDPCRPCPSTPLAATEAARPRQRRPARPAAGLTGGRRGRPIMLAAARAGLRSWSSCRPLPVDSTRSICCCAATTTGCRRGYWRRQAQAFSLPMAARCRAPPRRQRALAASSLPRHLPVHPAGRACDLRRLADPGMAAG
jgi:hypothetical protein